MDEGGGPGGPPPPPPPPGLSSPPPPLPPGGGGAGTGEGAGAVVTLECLDANGSGVGLGLDGGPEVEGVPCVMVEAGDSVLTWVMAPMVRKVCFSSERKGDEVVRASVPSGVLTSSKVGSRFKMVSR